MSVRYMSRKVGDNRSVSRAQSVAPELWSRASSQIPEFGSGFSSRATTPGGDDRPWSSASTYNYYSNYSSPGFKNTSTPTRSRPVSQYKTNQDYYRGKVKSIYEREPMFAEFVRNLPLTDLHASSSSDLSRLKRSFQHMIEDRWGRKQCNDPSAPHDIAIKASPWSNYISKSEPASVILAEKYRYRGRNPATMPRITVYHRSTLK